MYSKKGYYLQLKNVFYDSCFPQGAQCIWAGKVLATIEVYNDKKFVEKTTLFSKPPIGLKISNGLKITFQKRLRELELLFIQETE